MIFKRFFLFLLLLIPFTSLSADVIQYDQLHVSKIDIQAVNLPESATFESSSIRARLKTKAGALFSQAEFDTDLKCLAADYDRVEPSLDVINGELYITLRIWTKPTIASITFVGNERVTAKKLKKELKIDVGTMFDREEFLKGFHRLKLLYVKKGYFESNLDYTITPSSDLCNVDIQINIDEGRAGKIKKICFSGFESCEEDDLLDLIVTRKYNFLLSWYTGRGCYHPDMVEHDQLVILNYLQNRGYADARVVISTEECSDDNRIILKIDAERGQRYYIGDITLCGNTLFTHEQIYDRFQLGVGGVYSPDQIRFTVNAIRDLYGMSGYIDAGVDVQLILKEDSPCYDLAFTVDEGQQYYVGMVRVFGNYCTQTKVILHESILCPGEVFDIRKLEATERRLSNTGYFCNVNVYAVKGNDELADGPHYRDVYIEVEETDTGNLGLFFGFSSLDNLFGGVDVTESNFNIAGLGSIFTSGPRSLRGGGEYLHMKANIGNRITTYILQWTKPYFMDTPWIVGFDLEKSNNRTLSRGYEIKTYGGNLHATYILNDFMKYDVHYRARHTRTVVFDDNSVLLDEEGAEHGFISAMGATWIYDSTDHPRRPTHGLRSRLAYEVAGLGGNFQFMKFAYLNSYYYPMCKRGVLKFRADVNFIHTYYHTTPFTLPLSERLFLGGETTVRGYRNYIIGPLFGNNEPAGGVSSYLLSEEFQYNLLKAPSIDAFAFVDAGYVSQSQFTLGQPAASVGFGLRFEVIRNMPMMLGLGFPIHPNVPIYNQDGVKVGHVDTSQRFFFSMGGCF